MIVVDFYLSDMNTINGAVVFNMERADKPAIQDQKELDCFIQRCIANNNKIHFNTRWISGNIFGKSIETYRIREINTSEWK